MIWNIFKHVEKKYFITFIDDNTKYYYVYLLRNKDEALEKFMHYKNLVENQLSKKIKISRSDKGGQYETSFDNFVKNIVLFMK